MASLAKRTIAVAERICSSSLDSRIPHRWPLGSTVVWPNSPAIPFRAAPDVATHNQAAADSGAERQHGNVGIVLRRAQPFFRQAPRRWRRFEDTTVFSRCSIFAPRGIVDPIGKVGRFSGPGRSALSMCRALPMPIPTSGAEIAVLSERCWMASTHVSEHLVASALNLVPSVTFSMRCLDRPRAAMRSGLVPPRSTPMENLFIDLIHYGRLGSRFAEASSTET